MEQEERWEPLEQQLDSFRLVFDPFSPGPDSRLILALLVVPLQRHFSVFALSFPGAEALATIYTSILSQHLKGDGFTAALQKSCSTLVQLALALHQRVSSTFLPTAIKFHYIFNLRDLSNIFQVVTH